MPPIVLHVNIVRAFQGGDVLLHNSLSLRLGPDNDPCKLVNNIVIK